jgi:hypothetical protein
MNDRDARLIEARSAVLIDQEMVDIRRQTRIQQIRDRLGAASQGPWHAVDLRHQRGGQIRIFPKRGMFLANVLRSGDNPDADAALIANAPADIAWLLDQLQEALNRLPGIDARCSEPDCGEPLRLIEIGAVGHCGEKCGSDG